MDVDIAIIKSKGKAKAEAEDIDVEDEVEDVIDLEAQEDEGMLYSLFFIHNST